jgi:hypothetical protein
MSADALIGRLQGVQGRGPKWRAICPAHESRHHTRTLSILETDDGRVLLHCHAGCDTESIVGAVGLTFEDLFPPKPIDHAPRVRKPWAARDVIAALKHELTVAWVLLSDAAAGRQVDADDRQRTGVARDRIVALLDELENAS